MFINPIFCIPLIIQKIASRIQVLWGDLQGNQFSKSRAEGTARGCQNRWVNPASQPPHGFIALLKALRNSTISVFSCFSRRAAFTGANFVAFVRWSAAPGNPINVLSAPRCPPCLSVSVFFGILWHNYRNSPCVAVWRRGED